jgi:hypothetical protein
MPLKKAISKKFANLAYFRFVTFFPDFLLLSFLGAFLKADNSKKYKFDVSSRTAPKKTVCTVP